MEIIIAVIGAILGLLGIVLYQRKQININKGILSTLPFKEELNSVDKDASVLKGLLEAEQQKRSSTASKDVHDASQKELLDFFNNNFKSDK